MIVWTNGFWIRCRERRRIGTAWPSSGYIPHCSPGLLAVLVACLPPMWLAFIPIVLLEALVLAKLLALSFGRAVIPALFSNLASTLIGVPLVWLVLAVLEMICCGDAKGLTTFGAKLYAVTVQAPWLIPYEQDLPWMVPCALAVIAIPCFVASVVIEAPINKHLLRYADRRSLVPAARDFDCVWSATIAASCLQQKCVDAEQRIPMVRRAADEEART